MNRSESRFVEPLDILRYRALRETEAALLYGLTHPDSIRRIPRVEAGRGGFAPDFARKFWEDVLEKDDSPPT